MTLASALPTLTALVASCIFVAPHCHAQCVAPMSHSEWSLAMANWKEVVRQHNRTLKTQGPGGGHSCSRDFRSEFAACLQLQPMWCWATAVVEVASYFEPSSYPVTASNNCSAFECKVVGSVHNKSHPDACCQDPDSCALVGGSSQDIIDGIRLAVGKRYVAKIDGPLTQAQLDGLLSRGHPVLIAIYVGPTAGHALTLGGCDGKGSYFVHNPDYKQGFYESWTYEMLVNIRPGMHWMETYYLEGDMMTSAQSEILV